MKRTGLQRRTRIRRVSSRRAVVNAKRAEFVRGELARRPWCEGGKAISDILADAMRNGDDVRPWRGWSCDGNAVDIHEPVLRSRDRSVDNILSPDRCVALCRACHDWVHGHPALATRAGLMRSAHGGDP